MKLTFIHPKSDLRQIKCSYPSEYAGKRQQRQRCCGAPAETASDAAVSVDPVVHTSSRISRCFPSNSSGWRILKIPLTLRRRCSGESEVCVRCGLMAVRPVITGRPVARWIPTAISSVWLYPRTAFSRNASVREPRRQCRRRSLPREVPRPHILRASGPDS